MARPFDERDFRKEYVGVWKPTPKDRYLHDLAEEYHRRTEEYDKMVCTGPMGRHGVLPANGIERGKIERNALELLRELQYRAVRQCGATGREVREAIQNWRRRNKHG